MGYDGKVGKIGGRRGKRRGTGRKEEEKEKVVSEWTTKKEKK